MAKRQIFIVEDDRIVAKDIKNSLEMLGFTVSAIASSGEETLNKLEEKPSDLVLMDIMLEGEMDGIETAAKIRTQFDIPVVYLTGYADEKVLQRAKITEPFGYVLKPFAERELNTAIEIALYKHKMERKLKEREQWLSTTLKSIGDAVIASDTQGRVVLMNKVAEELTGWTEAEAVGRPVSEVFHIVNEITQAPCENPVEKILSTGTIVGLANHTQLISKSGQKRIIADSGAPIMDNAGSVTGVVLVFRDITDRVRMEAELLKNEKLQSVGVLAGGLAHDFNNILAVILGNVSLAKMEVAQGGDPSEVLSEAEMATIKAQSLTRQLLTFSKGGAPVKKLASVSDVIKETAEFDLRGSNVRCEFRIADDPLLAEIDVGQMSQVIQNLIINADQAMPQGGTIQVGAENVTLSVKDALPLEPGKYIAISIRDQGTGIPQEHLGKVFDPYFTTKQAGSGLGLATAHSIVTKHGGHISVESRIGVGTTFRIHLPAISAEGKAQRAERDLGSPSTTVNQQSTIPPGRRPLRAGGINHQSSIKRVLLMDDEKSLRKMAGKILAKLGYETEFAKDGAEAIDLFKKAKESAEPFDAVILDLTIPGGMGGEEAVKKLQEIDPEVKAIVSSGYSNDPVMSNFRDYGFSGMVPKPFEMKELGKALHEVLKK